MTSPSALPEQTQLLRDQASWILENNRSQGFTAPNRQLYPHDWLWDTAFQTLGIRHDDPDRAAEELLHTVSGQWPNGMIPNMQFYEPNIFERVTWSSPFGHPESRRDIQTSAISQPPMLAYATLMVSHMLSAESRESFLHQIVPSLVKYHQWIYQERDFGGTGLFAAVHSYETGRDNDHALMKHSENLDWGVAGKIGDIVARSLERFQLRTDTRHIPIEQRSSHSDSTAQAIALVSLRWNRFESKRIAANHPFQVEDVGVNSILVANNTALVELADDAGIVIDDQLKIKMAQTAENLEKLWDEETGMYYSRDAISGRLLKTRGAVSLLPLFSGAIPEERAKRLIQNLEDPTLFELPFGIPTLAISEPSYSELGYWQGGSWRAFMNYLLAQGAERYGFHDTARRIRTKDIAAAAIGGFCEYSSARNGQPGGIAKFSPSAAIYIDTIASHPELQEVA